MNKRLHLRVHLHARKATLDDRVDAALGAANVKFLRRRNAARTELIVVLFVERGEIEHVRFAHVVAAFGECDRI